LVISGQKSGRQDLNLRPENHNSIPANKLQENQKAALAKNCQNDPDLKQIITAWPELPEHIKTTIKTLIDSAKQKK
jgi:hypothetical protein